MNYRFLPAVLLMLCSSLIPHPSSLAKADGGAVRLCERSGNYQIAVFTSPTPFRAGLVDVSVLVQDGASGDCILNTQVTVRLTARATGQVLDSPAIADAATNKLFQAAVFRLPEAGWWDVEVAVEGSQGSAVVRFAIQADEPTPRWMDLWPWYVWPALPVALFCIHEVLVRRKKVDSSFSKSAHGQEQGSTVNGGPQYRVFTFPSNTMTFR